MRKQPKTVNQMTSASGDYQIRNHRSVRNGISGENFVQVLFNWRNWKTTSPSAYPDNDDILAEAQAQTWLPMLATIGYDEDGNNLKPESCRVLCLTDLDEDWRGASFGVDLIEMIGATHNLDS